MGRFTIQQVHLIKRLTVHLELDSWIATGTNCGTAVPTVGLLPVIHTGLKRRVQWSPLVEPKQLGSVVDFTICTARRRSATTPRARDHPRSLHRQQTTKDGPALQGAWGCASLASRLGVRFDIGSDVEHQCVLQWRVKERRVAKYQLLPVPWESCHRARPRRSDSKTDLRWCYQASLLQLGRWDFRCCYHDHPCWGWEQ